MLVPGITNLKPPVPNDANLIGVSIYLQAASLSNVLGLSSLTELKIGAR